MWHHMWTQGTLWMEEVENTELNSALGQGHPECICCWNWVSAWRGSDWGHHGHHVAWAPSP